MTLRHHILFWLGALIVFLLVVWVLGQVLLPFIVGLMIAYLLGPLVRRMIRKGVPRTIAALIILLSFFAGLGIVLAIAVPFAYREAMQLADDLPQYSSQVQDQLNPYIEWLQHRFHLGDMHSYQETIKNNIGKALHFGSNLLGGILIGSRAVISFVTFMILTPIVAFFMMSEWVRITHWIDDMIPRPGYDTIRGLLTQMDRKVSGFIRGQLIVSAALGLMYAVTLSLAGLKFSVLIGLMTGLFSVVPLLGSTTGLITALGVAWFQSHDAKYVTIIFVIFMVGQFLEGNIITPRVMGKSVGMHPLWILFALLAGGALFGIPGMFLAVPVAAVIGVLTAFAIERYKVSPYYNDPVVHHDAPPPQPQVIIITDDKTALDQGPQDI